VIPQRRTILLALVLGLVTAWLSGPFVALTAPWLFDGHSNRTTISRHGTLGTEHVRVRLWPSPFQDDWRFSTFRGDGSIFDDPINLANIPEYVKRTEIGDAARYRSVGTYSAGWPIQCVRGWTTSDDYMGKSDRHWLIIIRGLHSTPRPTWIPLQPIPERFATNAAIHAGFWFVLVSAIGAERSARRRRRGQCLRCGYDLRDVPDAAPCPECGTARSPTAAASGPGDPAPL